MKVNTISKRRNVLAICGSTRSKSTNLYLIEAISNLAGNGLQIQTYTNIAGLPHFNPDLDTDNPPAEVFEFRRLIGEAAGVLICTPEYAMGVPGTLKNAVDWTVSSSDFSRKPVALITASTSGVKAHEALLGTLKVIEAEIGASSALLISFVKTKVNENAEITDEATRVQVDELIRDFIATIDKAAVHSEDEPGAF